VKELRSRRGGIVADTVRAAASRDRELDGQCSLLPGCCRKRYWVASSCQGQDRLVSWSHMELFASRCKLDSETPSPGIGIMVSPSRRLLVFRSSSPCSREIRCLTVDSPGMRFGQVSEKERELTTRKRESSIPKCLRNIPGVLHDAGTKYGDTDAPWRAGFDQVSCKLVAPFQSGGCHGLGSHS
jgi:hypothetical protein